MHLIGIILLIIILCNSEHISSLLTKHSWDSLSPHANRPMIYVTHVDMWRHHDYVSIMYSTRNFKLDSADISLKNISCDKVVHFINIMGIMCV